MSSALPSRPWSLKRRLPLIALLAAAASLLLACATFLVFDWTTSRRAAARELEGLSRLLAEQSGVALAFRDPRTAEQVLASLSAVENVVLGALYDSDGRPFAWYPRGDAGSERSGPDGTFREGGRLRVVRPVVQENRRIGTLLVESTTEAARRRLGVGIAVTLAVLAGCALVAFGTALKLTRPVVQPVLSLVRAMEQVAVDRRADVEAVAVSGGNLEVDRLVRGFKEMISGIREQELALERLALILKATSDFVGMGDPEGNALYVNRSGRRMIGLGEDEDVSRLRIPDFHPPESYALIREKALPAALRDGIWQGETELLGRDGRRIPVSQVIMAHRTPDGQLIYLSTIMRDLTELRNAQEAIRTSEEQLRVGQKMEALGRLAGGVAHDFNNLLTVMGGYAHFLSDEMDPESPQAAALHEISRSVERAGALTRQLLTFSRRQVVQPRVLDLNLAVREAEKMLRRLIGENIQLVTRLHPEPVLVLADASQLDQVLLNLVVNARDAMPKGGRMEIATQVGEVDGALADSLSLPAPGEYAIVSVSDTGCGMDAETQSHLFEPFFTTKEKGKGTGLGLSTVYGIVRQRGGGIQVLSRVGEGTEFRIFLPQVRDGVPAQAPETVRRMVARRDGVILLVEDEFSVRALMKESLAREGYEILEASDPREALKIAEERAGALDLVVTDVIMPTMSGPELAGRIRERRPSIPVLFVSGYPEDELGPEAALSEGTEFLAKPFTPADLSDRVRRILDRNASSAKRKGGSSEVEPRS
jgi:PAS domain S-box-containing protein